jgi:hypothetical protein
MRDDMSSLLMSVSIAAIEAGPVSIQALHHVCRTLYII